MTDELTTQEPASSGFFYAPAEATPRERIAALEKVLRTMPQAEITMRHHFADGVYAREGDVPAGTWFVGRVHHKAQINIISKGAILVLTESGPLEMRAPFTMANPPGAQRAAYALEDTVWTTLIATDETDPDLIFNKYTSPSYEAFEIARDELLNIIEG
jgi:hypothetical protein